MILSWWAEVGEQIKKILLLRIDIQKKKKKKNTIYCYEEEEEEEEEEKEEKEEYNILLRRRRLTIYCNEEEEEKEEEYNILLWRSRQYILTYSLGLWHINLCRLFNAKSIFIQINSSI